MIRAGEDFPGHVQEELEQWNISLFLQKLSDTPSTRASLQYEDSTFGRNVPKNAIGGAAMANFGPAKQFRYLSPPLRISPAEHLRFTPLLSSTMFHCLASPQDLEKLIISLLHTRCEESIDKRPLVIWEPAPPFCVPENLTASICAARLVDVVSPNHIELAALYGEAETALTASRLERMAVEFVERGIGPHGEGTIVVRAGELGCFVRSRAQETRWFPPYHAPAVPTASDRVVDPTGAGNAFLGAYSIGLLETGNILEATCYGVVGASFALEQVGLPKLNTLDSGREVWNGVDVRSRLLEYRERVNLTVERSH